MIIFSGLCFIVDLSPRSSAAFYRPTEKVLVKAFELILLKALRPACWVTVRKQKALAKSTGLYRGIDNEGPIDVNNAKNW